MKLPVLSDVAHAFPAMVEAVLEHVALGSDYDGTVTTAFDTSELAILTQTMLERGFSEEEIRLVMGGNVRRFLLENLPAG